MKNIKQKVSCRKAISISILTAAMCKVENNWNEEQVKEFCSERYKEIKRKYGYNLFVESARNLIELKDYRKTVEVKLNGKNVALLLDYKPLEDYLISFNELAIF